MSGSVSEMRLIYLNEEKEEVFRFPDRVARDILVQLTSALDYLHNGFGESALVHQAIRPRNILYKPPPHENHPQAYYQFKLVDFEDCIVYPRSAIQPAFLLIICRTGEVGSISCGHFFARVY